MSVCRGHPQLHTRAGILEHKEARTQPGGLEIFLGGRGNGFSQCGVLADPRASLCKGLGLRQGGLNGGPGGLGAWVEDVGGRGPASGTACAPHSHVAAALTVGNQRPRWFTEVCWLARGGGAQPGGRDPERGRKFRRLGAQCGELLCGPGPASA